MQNVFSPLLSIKQQQTSMASQIEQESPPNLDLQMLMSTLEAQQQSGQTSSANNFPPQLFEALLSQAFSQTNQSTANNLHLSNLEQSHLASEQGSASPPASSQALAEDTSTVVSTPTSAVPTSQTTEEDAAKFMAQLLRDAPALQHLPGQSQPTSPNLQDASALLEQLQFMGMLNGGNNSGGQGEQASEWKNAIANGALDLASLFSSQPLNFLNAAGQLTQQQRSTSSSSNDAYCDICNKQLCNRYFLRTHRIKKHNIIDPPSATQTPTSAFPLHHIQAGLQSPLKREGVDWGSFGVSSNEPSTPNRLDQSHHQQNEMPFVQLSDPPTKMPRLAPISASNVGREIQSPLKSPNQPNTQQQPLSRFSCDTCDKDFDTMSSLLQHQLQNHQRNNPNFPPLLMQNLNGSANNASNETPLSSPSGHETPHNQQQTPNSQQHTPSSGGQNSSNMLNQLLPGLQLPPAFQLPPLFNFGNLPSAFPFGGSGNELDMARMAQQLNSSGNNHLSNMGGNTQAVKTPKRQYTSTSKNFCDLCNKEVCNKYFLRTHMLKMHNIIIDENKTTIANINTVEREREGNLSFRCDYCKIKFDTRQQLREHKREIHNIAPASLSTGGATASSASSDCDANSKTPNSANAPLSSFFSQNSQLIGDRSDEMAHRHLEMDPSSSASSTAGTAGSLITSCQYCPETFVDNNKLSHHLVTTHYQELINELAKAQTNMPSMDEEELINQVALQMARDNQMEKAKEHHKDMTYKCSQCQREYSDAKSFNTHLQLHISAKKFSPKKNKRKILTPQKFKKLRQSFTCTKCQKRFITRIECQNHIAEHLREEKLALESSQDNLVNDSQTNIKCENGTTEVLNLEGIDEELLRAYMQEDSDVMQGLEQFQCSAVDEVVEQTHQTFQKQRNNNKEEKHSHTSGSASPSSTHMPEGFFHPLHPSTNSASEKFVYRTQSFVMRVANESLGEEEENGTVLQDICDHLVGTLPVRQQIHRPFRLTFDFQPLAEEEHKVGEMEVEETENIQTTTANI